MEKLFKRLFLFVILHFLLSCVATEVSDVASCPANEKFDPVKRICVSSVLYSVPPVGSLNSVSMLEDGLPLDVVLEYTDVDGDLATSCAVVSLSVGVDTSDGTCTCMGGVCRTTLIQTPDFSGFTEFYYTITDVNGVSQPKSVLVEVTPTNDAPSAADVSLSVNEDITLTSSLFAYGTDPDLDSLSFVKVSDPLKGSITFWDMNSGNFTYVPDADDSGTYTFLYQVCDNGNPTLCSSNYTVTIDVIPVDDAPTASSVSVTLAEGQSDYTITLPYVDVDGDKASNCSVNNPFGSKVDITSAPACECNALTGVCQTTVLLNDSDFNSSTGSTIDLTYTVSSGIPLLTSDPGNIVITVTSVNDAPTILVGDTDNDGLEPVGGKLSLASVDENTIVTLNNLGTSCSASPYECNAGIYLDEGGGEYEDAQALSLNITYESITPIPSGGVSDLIEQVEVYYDGNLRGTFAAGDTTDYVELLDTGAFDNDLLFIKIYPKADQFGSFLFSFAVKDSEGLTASSPTLIEVEYKNVTDNQPTVSSIDDIVSNEADVKYTNEFVIDEGGGISEDFQNIYFEVQSSNTSLLPVNSIKAYWKYDDGVNTSGSFAPINGANAIVSGDGLTIRFNVQATYTDVFGTVMPNNEHYKLKLKLDSVDGVAGTSEITVTGNDYNSASEPVTFDYTVNPVGANHGGWKKIQVNGARNNRFGGAITGYETPKVELGWEDFNTAGSAGNTDHVINGWRVYRRDVGAEYDFDAPLNSADLDVNTREYSDATAVAGNVYFYIVRPVDSTDTKFVDTTNTGLSIPTKEIFSEVRVYVPPKGYNFIHRWMINREVCTKMLMDATNADTERRYDPLNNYRCPYSGPGETIVGSETYYDIGKDLVVDQIEAGCPYSVAPSCGSNGCIGIGAPTAGLADGSGKIYYNRTNGICYQDTGTWTEMDLVGGALASTIVDQSNNAFLPPLVNVSQLTANNFCSNRSDLTSTDFSTTESFLLPTRKEQIAYSAWSDTLLHSAIPPIELGLYLNSTSGCNSKNASGLETAYSDVDTPSTSYLYSVTGTSSSGIRSIYTGSQAIAGVQLTESCKSRYGLQDVYGNVAEWTRDRFSCHATDNTCEAVGTIDSTGVITENYYQTTDSYFDNYTMDSLKGPCAEGMSIDNVCDEPMTNWAIDTKSNRDGYFLFPVGLTVTNYFAENYDFSTVQESILSIGSSGISSEYLHDDGLTINSYLISKSPGGLAGLATSGSYLSAEYSGRYSVEFIPTQPVPALASNSTVGSNMNIAAFQDNQRHIYAADISGDTSLYIIGTSFATGGYPTFNFIETGLVGTNASVGYNSGTDTYTITTDLSALNSDVASALAGDPDFSASYTTYSATPAAIYSSPGAGSPVTAEIVVSLMYNPLLGNDFSFAVNAGQASSALTPVVGSNSHLDSLTVSLASGMTVTDFASYIHAQYGIGTVVGDPLLASVIEMVDIPSTDFTPNIVYTVPLDDAARDISVSYTHSGVGPYAATFVGTSLNVVVNTAVTTMGEVCTDLAAVSADVTVLCDTSSTIPVVPLSGYGFASTNITPIMNIAAINQSSPVTISFVSGASAGVTVDAGANTVTFTVAADTRVLEIVGLVSGSADASALINVTQLLNADLYGFRGQTNATSGGDVQLAADSTGDSGNSLYVSFVDTAVAGSETITIDGSHIIVGIQAGVTTATNIQTAINSHGVASNMITATALDGDRLQGILDITQLQNGVDSTDNKRVDVGFRCLAPISPATYDMASDVDADGASIHPYEALY